MHIESSLRALAAEKGNYRKQREGRPRGKKEEEGLRRQVPREAAGGGTQ